MYSFLPFKVCLGGVLIKDCIFAESLLSSKKIFGQLKNKYYPALRDKCMFWWFTVVLCWLTLCYVMQWYIFMPKLDFLEFVWGYIYKWRSRFMSWVVLRTNPYFWVYKKCTQSEWGFVYSMCLDWLGKNCLLLTNGALVTDHPEISQTYLKFFISVIKHLQRLEEYNCNFHAARSLMHTYFIFLLFWLLWLLSGLFLLNCFLQGWLQGCCSHHTSRVAMLCCRFPCVEQKNHNLAVKFLHNAVIIHSFFLKIKKIITEKSLHSKDRKEKMK